MRRAFGTLAVVLLVVTSTRMPDLRAQSPFHTAPSAVESPIQASDRLLQASIDRIAKGSALWRQAVAAVSKTGRRGLLVAADDDTPYLPKDVHRELVNRKVLAEAVPLLTGSADVPVVVVFVNVPLVQNLHDGAFSALHHFESDLDRIVIHEVYGHGIPYLLAGNLSGRCADPQPGQTAVEACSISRENAVRAELGLGRRVDHGLSSLMLARLRPFRDSQ